MFKFFSKKEQIKSEEPSLPEKEKDDNLDKEVVIYTMPERFRGAHLAVAGAKKTGALILILGALFLIAMIAGGYYFIFIKKPAAKSQKQADQEQISTTTKPEEQPAEKIPAISENIPPKETATSITTSTLATTTAEQTGPMIIEEPLASTTIALRPGADQDGDGLTDLEEALLGANETIPDTDGDGYNDLSELMNFYNPAGSGKLDTNPLVRQYNNKTYKYSLLYPMAWEGEPIGGDDSVIFRSPDNQFIQIIAQPNQKKMTISEWHEEQFGDLIVGEERKVANSDWQGIWSKDGLIIYLTDKELKNIYTITYTTGESDKLEYINIFKAMVKNLKI
jgi:hypothetical protein